MYSPYLLVDVIHPLGEFSIPFTVPKWEEKVVASGTAPMTIWYRG
jgi:hypothetical protein